MKLKVFTLPSLLILSITLLIASCAKDGATGPAGPAGPAGPQGTPGAAGGAGATGAKGDTGVANVMYSDWIDTTTWKPDTAMTGTVIDTFGFFATINAPKLDVTLLNTGEIKVYVNVNTTADPVVFSLPYNDGNIFIDAVFFTNGIQLSSNADLTDVPFRYILIPGGVKVGRPAVPGGINAGIDWNDYKQVKKYLNLKD